MYKFVIKPRKKRFLITHSPYLVFGRVLCDPPQAGLHDMVTIQELLLSPSLGPDLVLGVGSEEVQGRDVKTELPGLCELSEAGPERDEILSGDV